MKLLTASILLFSSIANSAPDPLVVLSSAMSNDFQRKIIVSKAETYVHPYTDTKYICAVATIDGVEKILVKFIGSDEVLVSNNKTSDMYKEIITLCGAL